MAHSSAVCPCGICAATPISMLKALWRSLVLALALACSAGFAATDKFADAQTLGQWITYYYVQPEPQRVGEAIRAASSKGFMQNGKAAPFIGFIAGVANKSPSMAQTLAKQFATLAKVDQPVVILGVWYSGHPEAKPLLERFLKTMPAHKAMIEHLLASAPLGLLELPLEEGPWVLDALWGYFMATGDAAPVARIITALPWVNIRGDVPRLLVGGAARWSLISNAIQHERVMAVCRNELASQSPDVRMVLSEVIASAEKDMKEGKTR
jgi:hypothetical protein